MTTWISSLAALRPVLAALAAAGCLWLSTAGLARADSPVHIVQPGETLAAIARQHNTDTATLMQLNKLNDPNLVMVGQRLLLPGSINQPSDSAALAPASELAAPTVATQVYIVQPDDSLSTVAAKFRTTPAHLAELNQRAPSASLYVGEPLRVPEGAGVKFASQPGQDIPVPGKYYVHTVQDGESLASIAKQYNTSLRRTIEVNHIPDAASVKAGQRIVVPPPSYADLFADVPVGPEGYPVYPVIPTQGKWISVDLNHQRAWAWEGDKLIKAFWISSGKARTPTVTGVFRIWAKVPSQTMVGGSRAAGDYYNLPNVQWVQYFYHDYSFHGAWWHHNFGTPMSHGCINMSNADAKWLYEWADPKFDDYGWHVLDGKTPGALVVIYQ